MGGQKGVLKMENRQKERGCRQTARLDVHIDTNRHKNSSREPTEMVKKGRSIQKKTVKMAWGLNKDEERELEKLKSKPS